MRTCETCRHWTRLAAHDRLLAAFDQKDRSNRGHCSLPNESMFGFDMNEQLYVSVYTVALRLR